jgi:hypothetical protein
MVVLLKVCIKDEALFARESGMFVLPMKSAEIHRSLMVRLTLRSDD